MTLSERRKSGKKNIVECEVVDSHKNNYNDVTSKYALDYAVISYHSNSYYPIEKYTCNHEREKNIVDPFVT